MQRMIEEAVEVVNVQQPWWEERYQQLLFYLDPQECRPGRIYVGNVLKSVIRNNVIVEAIGKKWTTDQIEKGWRGFRIK